MSKAARLYNISPSFSYIIPKLMADILNRDYCIGKLDPSDVNVHNGIEHDASLARTLVSSPIDSYSHACA